MTARAGGGSPDRVGGGGLLTGGQGSKVCVLCAEPKENKCFRPGTRPGGIGFPAGRIGDWGDREIVYVPNVYVPFPAPIFAGKMNHPHCGNCLRYLVCGLAGRNRATAVITESLAQSYRCDSQLLAFVGGHISLENTEINPHRLCVRCAAIRIARLAFIRLTFVPHGTAEWLARVGRVR